MASTYSYTEKSGFVKNFGKLLSAIEVPSLLAIQMDSYRTFLEVIAGQPDLVPAVYMGCFHLFSLYPAYRVIQH